MACPAPAASALRVRSAPPVPACVAGALNTGGWAATAGRVGTVGGAADGPDGAVLTDAAAARVSTGAVVRAAGVPLAAGATGRGTVGEAGVAGTAAPSAAARFTGTGGSVGVTGAVAFESRAGGAGTTAPSATWRAAGDGHDDVAPWSATASRITAAAEDRAGEGVSTLNDAAASPRGGGGWDKGLRDDTALSCAPSLAVPVPVPVPVGEPEPLSGLAAGDSNAPLCSPARSERAAASTSTALATVLKP